MKDKEAELKSAEQKLHDEFERLRRQNAEEKRQLDDKRRQLVCSGGCAVYCYHAVLYFRRRKSVCLIRRRQLCKRSERRPRESSLRHLNLARSDHAVSTAALSEIDMEFKHY